MSGTNTAVPGMAPTRVRRGYFTGLNINSTEASRTAISSGTGGTSGRIAVGDVLIRDPNGPDKGVGSDFTQPQTSYLHEQAVVVTRLYEPPIGTFTRSSTAYYPQEFECVELSEAVSALVKANATAGSTVLGLANASCALQAITGATLTDSSTGTASATIAAGAGVQTLSFPVTIASGTSAADYVTNYTIGYKFKILSWSYLVAVATAGASGSRVFNMEIGTTDVGTTPSTCTITTAGDATIGGIRAGTAVSGANTGTSSDTFSIEVASGGTSITGGSGAFLVVVQNMDTADAIASLAAAANSVGKIKALAMQTADTSSSAAVKTVKFAGPMQQAQG